MEDGRTRPDGSPRVIVVARDAPRLVQYQSALRVAGAPTIATMDPDAAVDLLAQHHPAVLVLDQGLPRLALFRLYGVAREDESDTPIQVVFVGQDDDTGPDDHYLPGAPSPSRVAVQVTSLLARVDAARPAPSADAAAPPAAEPQPTAASEPVRGTPAASVSDEPPGPRPTPPPQAAPALAASANGQTEVASVAAPPEPDVEATPATETPRRKARRMDVMLVRIGLVLLILGGLLFLLQMQMSQGPLVAPTLAPAAPTRRPSPSPSPSADLGVPAAYVSPTAATY